MRIFRAIKSFFAAAKGAVSGVINGAELVKSISTAVAAGGLSSGAATVLPGLIASVPAVVPDAPIAGLVTAILTLILDLYRRKAQGTPAAPTT